MNFSQTLEKLMDENGVTAYKLIEDSKRPANYGGPSLYLSSLRAELVTRGGITPDCSGSLCN